MLLHNGVRCKQHRSDLKAQAVRRMQGEILTAEKERRAEWIRSHGVHGAVKPGRIKKQQH